MSAKFTPQSTLQLLSGHHIPLLGYGVYQTLKSPKEEATELCRYALEAGYRHIDSATAYRNQGESAAGIKISDVPRSQVFFATKIAKRRGRDVSFGYDEALQQINAALEETGLEYLDLVLIHAPYGGVEGRKGAWRALVDSVENGKVRAVGVSNYGLHHLDELEAYIKELEAERGGPGKGGVISVGQYELHPWLTRPDIVKWLGDRGIAIEAYCPLVRGERWGDPKLKALAKKHGKTEAQILLRWSLQRGFVPLVKSVTLSRIVENAGIFDFELTGEDVADLATDEYSPCTWDPTVSTLGQ